MFKLYASGDLDHLNYFLQELKSNPRFDVALETKECYDTEHGGNRGKIVVSIEIKWVDITTVILETENGVDVKIPLMYATVLELNGFTSISGVAFDIFA